MVNSTLAEYFIRLAGGDAYLLGLVVQRPGGRGARPVAGIGRGGKREGAGNFGSAERLGRASIQSRERARSVSRAPGSPAIPGNAGRGRGTARFSGCPPNRARASQATSGCGGSSKHLGGSRRRVSWSGLERADRDHGAPATTWASGRGHRRGRGRTARLPRRLQPPPHLLTTLSAPAGGGRCVRPLLLPGRGQTGRRPVGFGSPKPATRGSNGCGGEDGRHPRPDAADAGGRRAAGRSGADSRAGRPPETAVMCSNGRGDRGETGARSFSREAGSVARMGPTTAVAGDRGGRGLGGGQREFSGQTEPASARRRRIPS